MCGKDPDAEATILQINLAGKDSQVWRKIRPKLIAKISSLLDATVDPISGTTLREEGAETVSGLLAALRAKLARPDLENQRVAAEIAASYARTEKDLAEADKTREEAAALRADRVARELRTALQFAKAMVIRSKDEDAILFGEEIDAMLLALDSVAPLSSNMLPPPPSQRSLPPPSAQTPGPAIPE